jgi:hypothetical protein
MTVEVSIGTPRFAVPVAGRLARALGAAADLPISRLDDAALMCDALLADVGRPVSLRFRADEGVLDVAVTSLPQGRGQALVDGARVPEIGPIVSRLADAVVIDVQPDGTEDLVLTLRRS